MSDSFVAQSCFLISVPINRYTRKCSVICIDTRGMILPIRFQCRLLGTSADDPSLLYFIGKEKETIVVIGGGLSRFICIAYCV